MNILEKMIEEKVKEMFGLDRTEEKKSESKSDLYEHAGKYVLLSTDETKRGVFFGKLADFDREKKIAIMDECQMAVKWSVASKGFNSLAVTGPVAGSRITKGTKRQELDCVSCIVIATDEAVKQWKKCVWDD